MDLLCISKMCNRLAKHISYPSDNYMSYVTYMSYVYISMCQVDVIKVIVKTEFLWIPKA